MAESVFWVAHRDPCSPQAGGAERSIFEICTVLAQRGWAVKLFATGFHGASRSAKIGNIQVVRLQNWLALHVAMPVLFSKLRNGDVFVEDLAHVVPFAGEKFTKSPGVVFFRHLHRRTLGGQVDPPLKALLSTVEATYPLIYKRSLIVAPSDGAYKDLRALGFSHERIARVQYGVDEKLFKPGEISPNPSLIHFSGLRRYKRPEHALLVLRILRDRGCSATLRVVGNGPELPSLVRLCSELGLEKCVSFCGRVSNEELALFVSQSWVHVQCSVAEGWGLTASEAASAGVPTVAYSVPGLVESVTSGVTGILVESGNVYAMADAIEKIIRTRKEWTGRCRDIGSSHSWQTVGDQWDQVLRGLASRR